MGGFSREGLESLIVRPTIPVHQDKDRQMLDRHIQENKITLPVLYDPAQKIDRVLAREARPGKAAKDRSTADPDGLH